MKRDYLISLLEPIIGLKKAEAVVSTLEDEDFLPKSYGDPGVNAVVDTFKEHFGTSKVTKYDRFAASRLVSKNGVETVTQAIVLLSQNMSHKYAPVPRSISQLEDKWISVVKFLKGINASSETLEL